MPRASKNVISLDTETTGIDHWHGAEPFFITFGLPDGNNEFCEWEVDPKTRRVLFDLDDLRAIQARIDEADELVFQNAKFDFHALTTIFRRAGLELRWPWERVRDTLLAGHLLASNHSHDLTSMCVEYLGVNIQKHENRLERVVKEAAKVARREFPSWRLAAKGLPEMPSAKEKVWKYDSWLPRAAGRAVVASLRFDLLPDEPVGLPAVVRAADDHDVSIGRPSKWGNPWKVGRDGSRREVVTKYAETILNTPRLLAELHELRDKRLGCAGNCAPDLCHGHVLRALCHPWFTALRDYANADSVATLALWGVQERLLKERGLWAIYLRCLKKPWVAAVMERNGVTANGSQLTRMREQFAREAEEAKVTCVSLAACDGLTDLPKSGVSNALKRAMFGRRFWRCTCGQEFDDPADGSCPLCDSRVISSHYERSRLDLEPVSHTEKSGAPAVDKAAIERWLATLPEGSDQRRFVAALRDWRKCCTATNYLDGYERFWLPLNRPCDDGAVMTRTVPVPSWFILHPSLNPTGTDTLRWSSSNPNAQNVSKQEGFGLRFVFGPAPGREWWSADAQNIELRIPAFEANEPDLVRVFEHPDEPPYFGSYHLVVFAVLHPEKFAKHGAESKRVYESTWYQWTKNGNFALIYGAQDVTADAAYHVPGAREMIWRRFPRIAALSDRMLAAAERTGVVETIPDRSVDSKRGYPILCTRSERGRVLPTVPLNYHVQSTAMQWMSEAMIRCQEQLDRWGSEFKMVLQVHDELVFDFPRGRGPEPWRTNLPKIRRLKSLMESCGDDIGVPTPVAVEYHSESWAEGKAWTSTVGRANARRNDAEIV